MWFPLFSIVNLQTALRYHTNDGIYNFLTGDFFSYFSQATMPDSVIGSWKIDKHNTRF